MNLTEDVEALIRARRVQGQLVGDAIEPKWSEMSRVLIVDDEPHVREVLRDFLTRVGDEVATAATGAAALEAVPTFQPDVILLDMVMPGMSGADVLDALRRAGLTVPVILISGQPITPPEGFFAFLRKPFDLRKLAELVTAAVGDGRAEHA